MNAPMQISGSGTIPSGEYSEIRISGSGKLQGNIKCQNFLSSGSCQGEQLICEHTYIASGSVSFSGNISANTIKSSGSFSCQGSITANQLNHTGSMQCSNSIKCQQLLINGALKTNEGIEAEELSINGAVSCHDLINAENVEINFWDKVSIGSIGGNHIQLHAKQKIIKFLWFSLVKDFKLGKACVYNTIEGNQIHLDNTNCPRVSGRVVRIGKGCQIDLVQYTDSIEIHPNANVKKIEKV